MSSRTPMMNGLLAKHYAEIFVTPGRVGRWILLILLVVVPSCRKEDEPLFERLMNLGKAYVENRDADSAIEVLEQAVSLRPRSAPAQRNLARAYYLVRDSQQAPQALQRTLEALRRASQLDPDSAATSYLLGLTDMRLSLLNEAVRAFETAVRLDPHTPTLRFQLAGAYRAADQPEKAVEQLRETVRLDPLHSSAHFKLMGSARRAGDLEAFDHHHREFMRLRELFGEQSRTAEALEQCRHTQPEAAPAVVPGGLSSPPAGIDVRFTDVTTRVFVSEDDQIATAAAVLEVDQQGVSTLFVAGRTGYSLLKPSPDGTLHRTELQIPVRDPWHPTLCVVGDFHNDVPEGVKYDPEVHALADVIVCALEGIHLLKRSGVSTFRDVTRDAGLAGLTALRAHWVDYDHDGDLDLALADRRGLALWQNNGDGRFSEVTREVGIEETGSVTDVAAGELDGNVAVDLIVARDSESTLVFLNQRAGRFGLRADPPGPWPAARRLLVNDLNNDGHTDAVLVTAGEAVVLYGHAPTRRRIDLSDLEVSAIALVDYDNDGWLDLCVGGAGLGGAGVLRLYRNLGARGWADAGATTGLASVDMPAPANVIPCDIDADGDTDLVIVGSDGKLRVLRNDGGNFNKQIKVRLATVKSNPTGLGVHIEARAGRTLVTRAVTGPAIEIGLGQRERLDTLQTVWTNGIVDNQIDVVASATPVTIVEKNVAVGSCPFLYAWDGRRFRFVTDLLGNAPVGLSLRRDVLLPADPDEIVMVAEAEAFPPLDGMFTLVVTDEFREVLYLDEAHLIAVDHPPDTEVHATDKLMPDPFPPSEVWTLGARTKLLRAHGSDGTDRTEAVLSIDGKFAPPGPTLPAPFRGMCYPMSLTLDFGAIDEARPLVLALTGWLQYGDASTNIAMSQSSALSIVPPTLEAEVSDGRWQPVDVVVGMPAGKTKTILVDLSGRLPAGTRRLRLTTSFEIRWDRIALFERVTLADRHVHELRPGSADLAWRGFSQIQARGPGHPTTPNYDDVSDKPPWRTALSGWCTRYGHVRDLVTMRDQRLVILNSGDALILRFDSETLPPIPAGLTRTFFFHCVGWDKDGDYNVVGGDVVGHPPVDPSMPAASSMDGDSDWRVEYNTRWVPFQRFQEKR